MKHVFYVHSHITFAVALGVMKSEEIDASDAAFLSPKRYRKPIDDGFTFIELPPQFESFNDSNPNPFFVAGKLKEFKKFLKTNDIKEYHSYIPHKYISGAKLLIGQEECLDYSFIEEGIASYNSDLFKKSNQDIKSWMKSIIYPWKKMGVSSYFDEKYRIIYCTRESAFFSLPRRRIVDAEFWRLKFSSQLDFKDSHIIALSPLTQLKEELASAYTASLFDLLENIKGKKIYYKPHPDQYNTGEEKFFDHIFKKFDGIKLDRDFCLESLQNTACNMDFHFLNSSICLYLTSQNIRLHNLGRSIKNMNPVAYAQLLSQFPERIRIEIEKLCTEEQHP